MKLKSQKGSITIFVLIALLFYTAFLLLMYAANTNKFKTITEKSDILKGIYERNISDESINNLVDKIVDGQIMEHYLDRAPITLKEIGEAKEILKEKLKNIYHTRIAYPEIKK